MATSTYAINPPPAAFVYTNSLQRPYGTVNAGIKYVCFDICRIPGMPGGASMITLTCEPTGSEADAIAIAEQFLSKPLTEEYYEMTMDRQSTCTWQQALAYGYEVRGDVLSSLKYIEHAHVDAKGCLTLSCGS